MEGQPPLELEIRNLNSNALVADIVYTPLETAFLKRAKDQGNSTLGGLGMLLHQAVRGFELWFGIKPEVTAELCELVAADVQKGAQAMITVGLTGSIAAGKSEVAKLFSSAGIPVFDSDAEVHELYAEKSTTDLIGKTFPDVIVNGSIDRQRLGQHVLESPEELKKLESLIHPLVKRSRERFICHWRKQNCPLVILDIPLLYETGEDQKLDYVVVVSANEEIQRNRAMTRPGMTREKLASILARQLPDSEKSRRADFVIENSASLEHLRKQVDALSKKLGELARSHKS